MPGETSPHRQEKRKYTLVFIPGDESNATRTLSFGKYGIVAFLAAIFASVAVVVILILIFTPLGAVLPIGHPELEERYRGQALQIQEQLNGLMGEMVLLRSYNTKLRKALGEKNLSDTVLLAPDAGTPLQPVSEEMGGGQTQLEPQEKSTTAISGIIPVISPGPRGIDFPLLRPVQGYVTRGMNPDDGHFGMDIAGRPGSPVLAPADGRVVFADWSYDFGFMMIVNHARGYTTVYKHNQEIVRTVGVSVKRGELIAFLGNTGRLSSGPHLHFELWKDGIPEDPERYLLNVQ